MKSPPEKEVFVTMDNVKLNNVQSLTSNEYLRLLSVQNPNRLRYLAKRLPDCIRKVNLILDNLDELQHSENAVVIGQGRLIVKPKEDGLCFAADLDFGTLKYKLVREWPEYNPAFTEVYPVDGQWEYGTKIEAEHNLWKNERRISLTRYMKSAMEDALVTINSLLVTKKVSIHEFIS